MVNPPVTLNAGPWTAHVHRDGRGGPRDVPRDRISPPDARAFYGRPKDNGHLGLAEEIGDREDFPTRIVHWTPEQIDLATVEILARAGHR